MKIPLNSMDEMFMHLDVPTRPLTVHLEVRVNGALDEGRMRKAVQVAVEQHPVARARLAPWRADAKKYEWLVEEEELQIDPVRAIEVSDPASLDDVRGDLVSRAISLFESPPFRIVLVHDAGGDHVMLVTNHVACDGIGALRLMQSVGRAYADVPDPTVEIDAAEAHRLAFASSAGPGIGDLLNSGRLGLQQLAQNRSRLAKVAAKDGSSDPGYCVHTMSLPLAPVLKSELRHRLHATVNDVLLAAVHRSIGEWNRQHGKRAGRISIGMPVNARPEAWRSEVVGNFITSEMVPTLGRDRQSPEQCLTAVARWTDAFKRRGSGLTARGAGTRVGRSRVATARARLGRESGGRLHERDGGGLEPRARSHPTGWTVTTSTCARCGSLPRRSALNLRSAPCPTPTRCTSSCGTRRRCSPETPRTSSPPCSAPSWTRSAALEASGRRACRQRSRDVRVRRAARRRPPAAGPFHRPFGR